MKIDIISLFPEIAKVALSESIMGRAAQAGIVEFGFVDVRDYGEGKHRRVDDRPFGGGPGMVLKAEPLSQSLCSIEGYESAHVVLLSPQGRAYSQQMAQEYGHLDHLILVCGHYEGVDQRFIDKFVDEEVSIGDYVLTNGVIAANIVVDSVVRLLPGALGDEMSAQKESFSSEFDGGLEGPAYTQPAKWEGVEVPEILRSGDHGKIQKWRQDQAKLKTKEYRPDLLDN